MNEDLSNYVKFIQSYFFNENSTFEPSKIKRLAQFVVETNNIKSGHLESLKNLSKQITFLELNKINFLKDLATADIPTIILLKSSALNGHFFRNTKMRGSSDLDILIDIDDYDRLKEILEESAVKLIRNGGPFSNIYEETWFCKKYNCYIDLHIHLLNPLHYNISSKDIIEKSLKHESIGNEKIRVPCLEHMLIHIALHFVKDGNYVNQSVFDYFYLKENYAIDYSLINKYNQSWDCIKAFKLSERIIEQTYLLKKKPTLLNVYTMSNWPGAKLLRLFRCLTPDKFFLNITVYFLKLLRLK